ncbi:MAG: hypothetical protein FWG98_08445 [Candidatus Cloacimonetes bacterium]|nr:hypothetical protein [Candidatus Cloacimonadota bacterium]
MKNNPPPPPHKFYSRYWGGKLCFLLFFWSISLFLFSVNSGQFLSESLVKSLKELNLENNVNLFIDLQTIETDDLNKFILQEKLLIEGYSLVEIEDFANYFVTIRVEESFISRRSEKFPRSTEYFIEKTFLVQFTRKSDSQILNVWRYVFLERHQEENVVQEKWYTPFLVAFVIGSLIYLLFYGN